MRASRAQSVATKEDEDRLSSSLDEFHEGIFDPAGSKTLTVLWRLLDVVIVPYSRMNLEAFSGRAARL